MFTIANVLYIKVPGLICPGTFYCFFMLAEQLFYANFSFVYS